MPDTLDVPRIDDVTSAYAHEHVTTRRSRSIAMVSDRGRHRARNEDAGAVAVDGPWSAIVVCDGVGTSRRSERASASASIAARDALLAAHGRGLGPADQLTWAVRSAGAAAAMVALEPVDTTDDAATPTNTNTKPPACTLVAAVTDGRIISATSVGDSRAYWIPDDGEPLQLTSDDSFAAMMIANGKTAEQAARSPYAHVITAWLGENAPQVETSVVSTMIDGPGWLLTCSDGLWNYVADPAQLAALIRQGAADASTLAESLVSWANEQGGEDNITVGVTRVRPS